MQRSAIVMLWFFSLSFFCIGLRESRDIFVGMVTALVVPIPSWPRLLRPQPNISSRSRIKRYFYSWWKMSSRECSTHLELDNLRGLALSCFMFFSITLVGNPAAQINSIPLHKLHTYDWHKQCAYHLRCILSHFFPLFYVLHVVVLELMSIIEEG